MWSVKQLQVEGGRAGSRAVSAAGVVRRDAPVTRGATCRAASRRRKMLCSQGVSVPRPQRNLRTAASPTSAAHLVQRHLRWRYFCAPVLRGTVTRVSALWLLVCLSQNTEQHSCCVCRWFGERVAGERGADTAWSHKSCHEGTAAASSGSKGGWSGLSLLLFAVSD